MNTELTGLTLMPLSQPYGAPPWNYGGSETVESISPNAVDWVLVELHDATDVGSVTAGTLVGKQAGFLFADGSIVGLDGVTNLQFDHSVSEELFVIIRHRNHLDILSANSLLKIEDVYYYNFTTGSDKVSGGESGYKDLGSGIWGMVCGDAYADGIIDDDDRFESWYPETGESGYLGSDVNLNGQSNNQDKNDYWIKNYLMSSQTY